MVFGHQLSISGLVYNLGINYGINALTAGLLPSAAGLFHSVLCSYKQPPL